MFKLKKSIKDGKWYFSMVSGNNEIILQSEGYETKQNAIKGMKSVLTNAAKLIGIKMIGGSWYIEVVDTTIVDEPVEYTIIQPAETAKKTHYRRRKPKKNVD